MLLAVSLTGLLLLAGLGAHGARASPGSAQPPVRAQGGSTVDVIGLTNLYATISAPSTVRLGHPVTASAIVVGGTVPYQYLWVLNGGTGSWSSNSSFTFRPVQDELALVNLSVRDSVGNISNASKYVNVQGVSPISVSISAAPASGSSLRFTAVVVGGTPPYAFLWTGPGAPTSWTPLANWTSEPLSEGTYPVTVLVNDSQGFEANAKLTVNVGSASSPLFTLPVILAIVAAGVVVGAAVGWVYLRRRPPARPR